MTDLILAAKRGILSAVLSELRNCIPVDYQDEEQATALYWASCSGHDEIVKLLLDRGAAPNLPVKWGSTALHAAADRGHIKCIRLLLRYNAFINAVNSSGDTALHLAAYRGHHDVCMVLVGHKADLSIVNKKGKTPQHEAQSGAHSNTAILLGHKPTDHRPRSFPEDSSTGKEPSSKSVPLTSKEYEDWDGAHRSASYPLDQSAMAQNGRDFSKPTNSNKDVRITDERRSSLRRELLVQPNNRRGIKNIPYMNQLSQEDMQQYHLHHRPFSDPTALLHHTDVPSIEGPRMQSDPQGTQGNLSGLDEGAFRLAQQQSERAHYTEMLEENQVKVAMLVSKNEALEKKLKELGRRRSEEERLQFQDGLDKDGKKQLETRVKELMSEVQQERWERSNADARRKELADEIEQERREKLEADARSRHLASALFQIKSMLKITKPPGLGTPTEHSQLATPASVTTTDAVGSTGSDQKANSQRNFALKCCRSLNKTFVNSTSADLQHVLGTVLDDRSLDHMMTSLKTTAGQRLSTIATALGAHSDDVLSSVEPGTMWEKGKDYTFVGSEPIDSQLRRNEDGFATEVIFRIQCQSKMATMKMMLMHGQAPSLSKDVHYGSEWALLTSIPVHRNITRFIHCYSQPITDMHEQIKPFLNSSMGTLPQNIAVLITPEYRLSLDSLGALCSEEQAPGERCVLKILLELIKALHYLKSNGIIHRDIEPCKMFIDDHLRVVLGGFGMARRVVNESTQPIPYVERGQVMAGNPLAWSPELTRCNSEGPPKSYQKSVSLVDVYDSSDMYAVASSLCRILNQTPPDEESTPGISSRSHSPSQPTVPGGLSARLQVLLSAMLQETQADRPTLQEVVLRISMMLFGPSPETIKTQADCDVWIQSQHIRLLAVAPTPTTTSNSLLKDDADDFDKLAKTAEWLMCYDYVSSVTDLQLWELCQDGGGT